MDTGSDDFSISSPETHPFLTSQRPHSSVRDSGNSIPDSSAYSKGRDSMFGLRYAKSAFVETVFFLVGDSERNDDEGTRNEGAPSENAWFVLC
jgi:hypothetical protein